MTAPIVTWDRHRLGSDGKGVTTLVCFHGCPLRCKYCINPFTWKPETRKKLLTPGQLYEEVRQDELYFLATGGGVTLGGGEPLLYPDFIAEFRQLCGSAWQLCAETSLAVPWEHVRKAAECIDVFYIDCKDTDPEIYRTYTGSDNALMLENLQKLTRLIPPERIVVRIPRIPGYNTEAHQVKSRERFAAMGITRFDLFDYIQK